VWYVEFDPTKKLLTLRLSASVTAQALRPMMRAHAQALAATGGSDFGVLADLRGLAPLDRESANLFSEVKRSAVALPGFRARAVLVDSATIALQQKRSSIDTDTTQFELVTNDEAEAFQHLRAAM
jgi:hypothetical protein